MASYKENIKEAFEVLEGVALGDAFGELYSYYACEVRERVASGLVDSRWRYTDDTIMSLGVLECLARFNHINQEVLAWIFSKRYIQDTERGYGKMARRILKSISQGESWELLSEHAFQGGSMGNGAAMRATPLGAVALATAAALNSRLMPVADARGLMFEYLRDYLEDSEVKTKVLMATEMEDVSPSDALHSLDDYREAVLCAVEANGDCDTVAAITGGIVTARLGKEGLPKDWLAKREPLILQLA